MPVHDIIVIFITTEVIRGIISILLTVYISLRTIGKMIFVRLALLRILSSSFSPSKMVSLQLGLLHFLFLTESLQSIG